MSLRTHPRPHGRVTGRTDDMLIIRGVNVFPSQIESVLVGIEEAEPHYQLSCGARARSIPWRCRWRWISVSSPMRSGSSADSGERSVRRWSPCSAISITSPTGRTQDHRPQRRQSQAGDGRERRKPEEKALDRDRCPRPFLPGQSGGSAIAKWSRRLRARKPGTMARAAGLLDSMDKVGIRPGPGPARGHQSGQSQLGQPVQRLGRGTAAGYAGALHPLSNSWREELEEILSFGMQAVKLHPEYQEFRPG